jgi:hypothetical protein
VGHGSLRQSQQLPSVPHQLPVVAGDLGSNSGPPQVLQAVVEQHREGEEGVAVEGGDENCTACVGLLTMRQSECYAIFTLSVTVGCSVFVAGYTSLPLY